MRRTLLLGILLIVGCVYVYIHWEDFGEPSYLHEKKVPSNKYYSFEDLKGPEHTSVIPDPVPLSWKDYNTNIPSAFAIYLTDTASEWIGLVHGLKNIGIPVDVTTDIDRALTHKTVFVYPIISGNVLNAEQLQKLAAVPRNGGNLIGINIYGGGLNEVFGFDTLLASTTRTELLLVDSVNDFTKQFSLPQEKKMYLSNASEFPDRMPTNGYTNARTPLMVFQDDNTAFLTYKDYGVGKAFAFGIDLGSYFLRYMNGRGYNAFRQYANAYEPGMDMILRILKSVYIHNEETVTIGTVPYNKDVTLLLTHDIDFTRSIVNTVKYARMEDSLGVKATYFIQTKYVKDWNDDIFFKDSTLKYLNEVKKLGMEIGSHSISHSKVFSKFGIGSGKEYYPRYKPFVQQKTLTYNGSVLGELRVSKFLLEELIENVNIVSFRPGHLEYPFLLPQALSATGYKYSSSVTANNVQTNFPYMLMYDREFNSETDIVEIPVTIEDELGASMMNRLDSAISIANALGRYGGVVNVLIHTDTLGEKYEFEKRLIVALKDRSHVSTISSFGEWWRIRNAVIVKVARKSNWYEVTVSNPTGKTIEGLTLHVPQGWEVENGTGDYRQENNAVVINKMNASATLKFSKAL